VEPIVREAPYFVWRRGDGYVGCTRYEPRGEPLGNEFNQFEILMQTDSWDEARELIETERNK